MKKSVGLACFILLCLGIGMAGGLFTETSVNTWYPTLIKPSWNPPKWVFAPVWTVLYILMGISLWLIWLKKASPNHQLAYALFGLQLGLNFLWSILFFYKQSPMLALIDLSLLWTVVTVMLLIFARISSLAALLQIPYLAWLTYAWSLNCAIFFLNSRAS
ncbi:Translocator protein [Chlamydiales bacterium STE3]|nr:Translocator protein [Chlamydiales bacterium STE3]